MPPSSEGVTEGRHISGVSGIRHRGVAFKHAGLGRQVGVGIGVGVGVGAEVGVGFETIG
ncbi:MAG: hypothetical protein M1372_01575 [Patescibacteria group bacterium]|nr:hypothetical protein [Patescibacteria group bacterium]